VLGHVPSQDTGPSSLRSASRRSPGGMAAHLVADRPRAARGTVPGYPL